MPVDLAQAQAAFTAYFQTNAARIYRPQRTNVNGTVTNTFVEQASTTCHVTDVPQREYGLYNDKETNKPAQKKITLPYSYDLRESDRIVTLGKRWKVVNDPSAKPQFAMQTVAYVVDVTGE